MNRIENAVDCFNDGYVCSQAILTAFGPEFGLDRETALRVAGMMGGGISKMGEMCGAVTGAIMVLGLKYGKVTEFDEEKKEKGYEAVAEFIRLFRERRKDVSCRGLLGHDISTPEGEKYLEDNLYFDKVCPDIVKDAAEVLEEVLNIDKTD